MPVMTRFQVSHGKQPQVNFGQLRLVATHQKCKGKERIFDQTPKGKMEIEFTPPSNLHKLNIPRPSSLFEQSMLFTGSKDKSMDDMINDILLRQHEVEPLGSDITHENFDGTTSTNDFFEGNQHYSPFLAPLGLSPKSSHPMDDKIREDELEKIAYMKKKEKQVAQKINEILARSQEFLNKTPRTPNGQFTKVSIYTEVQG